MGIGIVIIGWEIIEQIWKRKKAHNNGLNGNSFHSVANAFAQDR